MSTILAYTFFRHMTQNIPDWKTFSRMSTVITGHILRDVLSGNSLQVNLHSVIKVVHNRSPADIESIPSRFQSPFQSLSTNDRDQTTEKGIELRPRISPCTLADITKLYPVWYNIFEYLVDSEEGMKIVTLSKGLYESWAPRYFGPRYAGAVIASTGLFKGLESRDGGYKRKLQNLSFTNILIIDELASYWLVVSLSSTRLSKLPPVYRRVFPNVRLVKLAWTVAGGLLQVKDGQEDHQWHYCKFLDQLMEQVAEGCAIETYCGPDEFSRLDDHSFVDVTPKSELSQYSIFQP
ncbi:hypothetical protein C365_06839, partial [Cryptococcus neoformans Bt85]